MGTERKPKGLLIGIDGFNLGHLDQLGSSKATTIRRLRDTAFYAPSRIYPDGRTVTDSGPGWSTILTGVWPDKHQVSGNDIAGHRLAEFPDFLTRARRIDPSLRTFYAASWPPLCAQILTGEVTHAFRAPSDFHAGSVPCDQEVADAVLGILRGDVDLGFAYFGSLDTEAHAHGATSAQYETAIETVDRHLAAVLDAIERRPSIADEDWLIVLATDHGHRPEGGHGGQSEAERSTFVIGTGDALQGVKPKATLVDIAPTLLSHVGVPADRQWGLDGTTLVKGSR